MKNSFIRTPSYFWEDLLLDSIPDGRENPAVLSHQRVCDAARSLIERTNQRLKAIRNNPTANESAREVQCEKILKQAKQQFEEMMNRSSQSIASEIESIQSEITGNIKNADRIHTSITMQKLNGLKPAQRASFIRRLVSVGDWESVEHIVGRSAAFLEIDPEEFTEIRANYISGKHPEQAQRLDVLREIQANYKKGFAAAIHDFDAFKSKATERAEKAQEAIHDTGDQ